MIMTPPIRDASIRAGDLTFHYLQWGEQGPPIVCLHGLTANAFCFQAFADELARDHRVFAFDLRGRGDSEKPEHAYSIPMHAADLAHLLDAWGLERPIVLGHSLGALVALYFAAHYPDKLSKLVLIDAGAPLPWNTPEEQPLWLTTSVARLGNPVPSFEEYIQRLKMVPFLARSWNTYLDLYFEHDVHHLPDGSVVSKAYREGILEEGSHFAEGQPEEQWARVQVPTLILRAGQGMFADNDQLLPLEGAAAMQRFIQQARYVNFPTLNHYTIVFGVEDGPVREIRAFVDA
ncbi:MAG: alpha/beta hydrolase [Chloroflexota bacterium]|nr:alpha/beta hydrolase [Chloroflexota bacterium]